MKNLEYVLLNPSTTGPFEVERKEGYGSRLENHLQSRYVARKRKDQTTQIKDPMEHQIVISGTPSIRGLLAKELMEKNFN